MKAAAPTWSGCIAYPAFAVAASAIGFTTRTAIAAAATLEPMRERKRTNRSIDAPTTHWHAANAHSNIGIKDISVYRGGTFQANAPSANTGAHTPSNASTQKSGSTLPRAS